jgi:transposase
MPKSYSGDLRERVIGAVEAGASRREAAERFDLSPSSAIKWVQRWQATGSAAAKPIGGSVSPLEKHAQWLLTLIDQQPDLTLDEVVAAMRKARVPGSRSAVHRFFERHNIRVKKNPARGGTRATGRRPGAAALDPKAKDA